MDELRGVASVLPEMLTGDELLSSLAVLPDYSENIRNESKATRLMALSDLYKIFLPSQMSVEIYSKLYLSLLRSMQKKNTTLAVRQRYENNKAIQQQAYRGIMGGSDSFTIIGTSGIGKSSSISRALSLILQDRLIETERPYSRIIPCLMVQCPFDSSVKGLLLEVLRKVDEELGTTYYQHAVKSRAATVDMLIGTVSTVALNHIGLLIVDEIQNVVNSKNGKSLIGMLTQLINNSGISICMVGTPDSEKFFEQAMQLARRSLGLKYGKLCFDRYFEDFCCTLYQYQYVRQKTEINQAIIDWLYEHSSGVISIVVSLVHDAQEMAILNGAETLGIEALEEAYKRRISLLHRYIEPEVRKQQRMANKRSKQDTHTNSIVDKLEDHISIGDLVSRTKTNGGDIVESLKQHMTVAEVLV